MTSEIAVLFGSATSLPDATFKHITFANGNITTGLGVGGAIQNNGNLTLDTVTFTKNRSAGGGAIFQQLCTGCLNPSLTITHCLFLNNSAGTAGGAVSFGNRTPVTEVVNTIIASNNGGNCSNASAGTFTGSHNLQFGDSTCTGMTVANPLLGPLTNNGGLTQTMALGAGSPAIDAGDTGAAAPTDQRGLLRNDGNGDGVIAADIGAFEAPKAGGNTPASPRRHRAVKP